MGCRVVTPNLASARAYACARQHTSQRGHRCDSLSTSASQPSQRLRARARACESLPPRARVCVRAPPRAPARVPPRLRLPATSCAAATQPASRGPRWLGLGLPAAGTSLAGCAGTVAQELLVAHTQAVARLKQHGSGHRGGAPPRAARHARRSSPQRTRTLNSPCRCGCPYCRVHCRASTVSAPTAASRSCQSCRAATLRAEREAGSFAVRGFAVVSFRDSRPYRNVLAVVFAAAI